LGLELVQTAGGASFLLLSSLAGFSRARRFGGCARRFLPVKIGLDDTRYLAVIEKRISKDKLGRGGSSSKARPFSSSQTHGDDDTGPRDTGHGTATGGAMDALVKFLSIRA